VTKLPDIKKRVKQVVAAFLYQRLQRIHQSHLPRQEDTGPRALESQAQIQEHLQVTVPLPQGMAHLLHPDMANNGQIKLKILPYRDGYWLPRRKQ
jgi:hypothetical protein